MDNLELLGIDKNNIYDYNYVINRIKNKNQFKLSLEADNFDKILNGGFNSSSVYLIFGSNSSGKTQLCHQVSVKAYQYFLSNQKKENQKSILYFDTENTFRPERITELSGFYNLNHKKVLKSILVSRIRSNSILLLSLKNLEEIIKKNSIGLFLIDSINHHYRFEKGEKDISYSKTKRNFLEILKKINQITKKFNLITIITAQITPNFIEDAFVKELPVAIQFLNHFFTEIIYLSHKKERKYYAHIVNSQKVPEKRTLYEITNEGIKDFKI
ncbi:MAG: hypothetical protein KGD63_02870 [Candidatus Lokiarchaeota archaeon]|nr:hypothetical protein [Candidatus Lokiarchaeota archaeon]